MNIARASVLSLASAVVLMVSMVLPTHAASNVEVAGKVLKSSGDPAASVWVIVRQKDSEKGRALTGDDGKYSIGRLGAGTYQIVVKEGKTERYQASIVLPRDRVYNVKLK